MKKWFQSLAYAMLCAVALTFAACAQLGIQPTQTFKDRLAVGYITASGVRDTATNLFNANKIGVTDARNVQAQADTARAALDIAASTFTTNPAAANDKLATTITLLGALQAYLVSQQGATK